MQSSSQQKDAQPEYAAVYEDQIKDMVDRQVAKKLTAEDFKYNGPIHYISHHAVIKYENTSTPVRIGFNTSATYKGHVLNEYWAKGPSLIINLLVILCRFREKETAVIGDTYKENVSHGTQN